MVLLVMAETKKVSWNASEGLIMEIARRRSNANSYFIQGDIRKAISTLIAIKQSVIQSFSQEERKNLTVIEDKFNKITIALSKSNSNSFDSTPRGVFKEANLIAFKIYSEFNDYLMDLLDDRGYLIGEQTDASVMKF